MSIQLLNHDAVIQSQVWLQSLWSMMLHLSKTLDHILNP